MSRGIGRIEGNVTSTDFKYKVATGLIPGAIRLNRMGEQLTATTAYRPLALGITSYTFATTEGELKFSSTSTQDAPGGTGITSVKIDWLDSTYTPFTTVMATNGTGEVIVSAKCFRINGFVATTVGTVGMAVGTTSLSLGGVVKNVIPPNYNDSRSMVFTIPKGYGMLADAFSGGSTYGSSSIKVMANVDPFSYRPLPVGNMDMRNLPALHK